MSLNVQEIKGFRAADKSYKKYDSRGLLLLVKPNGSKLWYFKYRYGGKEKKLPIGAFPEVSLSQARQLRDRARLKVTDGVDPMLERKRKKARIKLGAENTFEVIANKYIDEKMVPEGRAEATLRKARWFLDLLKPAIGNMPINDVDPQLMLAALKKLEAKGNLETDPSQAGCFGMEPRLASAKPIQHRSYRAHWSRPERGTTRRSSSQRSWAGYCALSMTSNAIPPPNSR